MRRSARNSSRGIRLPVLAVALLAVVAVSRHVDAFAPSLQSSMLPRLLQSSTTTSLHALNKGGKFNKQKDLAAKMAEAKRKRELVEGGGEEAEEAEATRKAEEEKSSKRALSAEEIKLRNDQQRFADMLETSLSGGGDVEKGHYLTMEQENENADAVFRGISRLYEGDPAPIEPFEGLLAMDSGEPLGKGGTKRLVPWEGSRSNASADYLVAITDPRPRSLELRTAMKRLAGALGPDALRKCVVINADTPAANRRFVKKNLGGEEENVLRIFSDEKLEWMREYTALGEKRFSMTMFVLRDGRVEKIAREVEAEMLAMVVKNALRTLN